MLHLQRPLFYLLPLTLNNTLIEIQLKEIYFGSNLGQICSKKIVQRQLLGINIA
jgi:hypothetical protein